MRQMWYNYHMDTKPFQSTKLWKETIQKLRLIAAITNSSMVAVADRLADEELNKVQNDNNQSTQDKAESDA